MAKPYLIVAALMTTSVAHAGGFGIPEVGVRRTGMAAVIGRPDELSSLYHNPAGLVLEDGWHVYISAGLSLLSTQFELHQWDQSDRFLGTTPGADGYYGAVKPNRAFGVIPMIAAGGDVWNHKLYLGASLFVGNATGASFDEHSVARYHLIDGYVVAPQGVIGGAYRLRDDLSIGASVGVINLRVHGNRDVFPIVMGTDISNVTGSAPKLELDGSGWAPSWMVAAFGRPTSRITWGATITGRVDATLEGPVKITYSDDAPSPGDTLIGTQKTQQLLPWAFMGGANVDVTPTIEIGGEFRYWLYRQYQRQHTDIVGIFLVRALDTEKDYHDSWEASGGVRFHDLALAPKLELMLGTQYDKSPAPANTVSLDQPSFSHWGLHSGLRYSAGRLRLGASFIHYWYQVPTIMNSITAPPSNFRGSGSNNIITISVETRL
ncbi:MAG: hypothetical protein JWO36_5557 [Myxococcales bacterium]|nr:hypothetical protein [Myxococcales bacterium]